MRARTSSRRRGGPFPYLAISCTCRATWAGKLRFASRRQPPFTRHSSQSSYRFRTDRENSMKLPSAIVVASVACLIAAPVLAQTTSPAAPSATVPVPATKRVTCLSSEGTGRARPDAALHGAGAAGLSEAGDRSEDPRRDQEEFHQNLRGHAWRGAAIDARPPPQACGLGAPG